MDILPRTFYTRGLSEKTKHQMNNISQKANYEQCFIQNTKFDLNQAGKDIVTAIINPACFKGFGSE